jgi:molybdate transport system regulatory protein
VIDVERQTTREATRHGLELRAKVWLERDGAVVISDFLADLLEAIAEHGSMAAAAEAMDLPYRTAWKKLREMEAAAGFELVESASGGPDGGGTTLSEEAVELVDAFRRVSAPAIDAAREHFERERRGLGS